MSGAFSRFTYESEPFDVAERQRQGKLVLPPCTSAESARPLFKHCALPPAPMAAGAFQRFRYSIDPFELHEDHKREELRERAGKILAGAFVAGGNARDEKYTLKRRSVELRTHIALTLRADWPSFLRMHSDERGTLVAAYAADRLSPERHKDLHGYMNRLMHTHPLAAEFGLSRDPTCWGVVRMGEHGSTAGVQEVLYALRPPWVAPNHYAMLNLLQQRPSRVFAGVLAIPEPDEDQLGIAPASVADSVTSSTTRCLGQLGRRENI